MFDTTDRTDLGQWLSALATMPRDLSGTDRIDRIRELEDVKAAASAAQARLAADFEASQLREQAEAGVPRRRQGEGIAAQIGLARRESPVRGAQHLALAKVLTTEMPDALARMTSGELSEWRATLLVRETAHLTREDRRSVDRLLCADPATLDGLSDTALVAEARRLAYRLDPESVVRRNRRAEAERTVTVRPAPDTMTYVTGLLPVTQGVAVYAALTHEADRLRAGGDVRSRGQIMADTLFSRVTGCDSAAPVPLHVNLVITDRTLLASDREPATLEGYGVVPAGWARQLVDEATTAEEAWLRRIYTAPTTGELVAMDSATRRFPAGLARFLDVRDGGTCRTPWCGAPTRHHDHVVPRKAGGPTSAANGQGLCERCNYAKEAVGWRSRPRPGPRHTVVVTTPTGHCYTSTAPPLPGTPRRTPRRIDLGFTDLVLVA